MRKLIFFIMAAFTAMPCFALQTKPIQNNETVSATVAQKGRTRLFVEGDRIASLHGTPNAYVYKNDDIHGQVFIMPTLAYQHKPFSLFITTESGKTYGLKLNPKNTLAESIMLRPKGNSGEARRWETASSYNHTIIRLIRYMVNDISPEGYEVAKIAEATKSRVYYLGNKAELKPLAIYRGVHLRGEIYQYRNPLNRPITVTETEFYRPGTRAIAIDRHTIPAHGTTTVYGVMSNG